MSECYVTIQTLLRDAQLLLWCRAASESSIAMAYRLADTLAAHGAVQPVDVDAAMQAISLILIFSGGLSVVMVHGAERLP